MVFVQETKMNNKVNTYNIEPLRSDNYHTWKFRMQMLLTEKGVDHMIEMEFKEENCTETEAEKKQAAKRKDDLCKNLIVQCVHDSQIDIIRGKKTGHAMWKCLESLYEQKGLSGQLYLKRKLMSLKLNEGEDLEEFMLKFDNVLYQLKATGADVNDKDIVCTLLMALPKSFETMVTIIENLPADELNLDLVKGKLRAEVEKKKSEQ